MTAKGPSEGLQQGEHATMAHMNPLAAYGRRARFSPVSAKIRKRMQILPSRPTEWRETENGVSVTFWLDCRKMSTAQQKKISFRMHRVFTNPKVLAGKEAVKREAEYAREAVVRHLPWNSCVTLSVVFLVPYPSGTAKKDRIDLAPMGDGFDCDNKLKAFQDGLTEAGWWEDDKAVSKLVVSKRRTTGEPRIIVSVSKDQGDDQDLFSPWWGADGDHKVG